MIRSGDVVRGHKRADVRVHRSVPGSTNRALPQGKAPPAVSFLWQRPSGTSALRDRRLRHYVPVSNLVTEEHPVRSAAFPVVDVHTHLGRWLTSDGSWMAPDMAGLLSTMEDLNVCAVVNLDGRWGEELEQNLDRYDRAYPDRFATFCQLDLSVLEQPRRRRDARSFARGVARCRRQGLEDLEEPGPHGHRRRPAPDARRPVARASVGYGG